MWRYRRQYGWREIGRTLAVVGCFFVCCSRCDLQGFSPGETRVPVQTGGKQVETGEDVLPSCFVVSLCPEFLFYYHLDTSIGPVGNAPPFGHLFVAFSCFVYQSLPEEVQERVELGYGEEGGPFCLRYEGSTEEIRDFLASVRSLLAPYEDHPCIEEQFIKSQSLALRKCGNSPSLLEEKQKLKNLTLSQFNESRSMMATLLSALCLEIDSLLGQPSEKNFQKRVKENGQGRYIIKGVEYVSSQESTEGVPCLYSCYANRARAMADADGDLERFRREIFPEKELEDRVCALVNELCQGLIYLAAHHRQIKEDGHRLDTVELHPFGFISCMLIREELMRKFITQVWDNKGWCPEGIHPRKHFIEGFVGRMQQSVILPFQVRGLCMFLWQKAQCRVGSRRIWTLVQNRDWEGVLRILIETRRESLN